MRQSYILSPPYPWTLGTQSFMGLWVCYPTTVAIHQLNGLLHPLLVNPKRHRFPTHPAHRTVGAESQWQISKKREVAAKSFIFSCCLFDEQHGPTGSHACFLTKSLFSAMQDTAPASDRGEQTRKSALIASLTPLPSALVRVGRHQRRLNSLAHVYCGDGSDIRTKKRKRKRKLKTRYRIRYGITLSTGPYGSSLFMLTPLLASPRVR